MTILRTIALLILIGHLQCLTAAAQTTPAPASSTEIQALHADLRGVKDRMVKAINAKNITALIAELAPDVAFTAINNDTVIGIDNIKAYFDRMLSGSSRFLNDFSMTSDTDGLSKLYANNTVAIATGRADAKFDLRGGSQMKFAVPLRWTATLNRGTGGWKLAAIHFSADFSDNPFLSAMSTFWKWVTAGVGLLGLVIGFLLGRKRRGARS